MTFAHEVYSGDGWAEGAAQRIAESLLGRGSVIVTGGDSAARLYPALAAEYRDWSGVDVLFSDERGVPPEDPASNYGLVTRLLLLAHAPGRVYRMRGEDSPEEAAERYEREASDVLASGVDVALLGMGADGHIAALFPGSPALEADRYCTAVRRPDGLEGITLTPRALLGVRRIFLIVTGADKAEAVDRALRGNEDPQTCPVRVLASHGDAHFLLDEPAAARL